MNKSVADDQANEANDWRSVLKHWKIGFVVTILSFGAACAVISQLTPYYKAYVQLLVPLKLVEDPGDRKGGAPQQADVFVVKSFTDLLTDNGIARKVIRDLNLTKSAEFQPRPNWFTDQMAILSKLLSSSEDGSSVFSADELTNDRILQMYEGRLKAVSESKDLTILLSFEAQDPRVAEQVVMAHARTFVQNEIDHRRKEFDSKVQWMKTELDRTAAEARDAQVAIQLNPTAMALSKNTSAAAVSDLKMRQLEATGTQAVYESVLKRYQDTVADQNYDGSEIRIVSEATLPTHPYFPKKLLSAAVAAVISIVFGFFAMGAASITRRISVDKLAEALELPIVTRINAPGPVWSAFGKKARSRRSLFWQRIQELRSVIDVTEKRHPITLVTSLMPKEGKSLVASALARSMALSGSRTLLIDLNARNARYALSLDGRMSLLGLTEYLEGTATAAQVSVRVDSASPLFLMTDRRAEATDLTRLSSAKLKARFAALRKDYDAIVIDAPALESLSDAFCVAGYADEIFFAVQAGSQHLKRLQDSIAKLRARSSLLKGVIVVDKKPADSDDLASINGYTFRGCLNEIWPKAKRLTLAQRFGLRRGRTSRDGKLNVNVEASI